MTLRRAVAIGWELPQTLLGVCVYGAERLRRRVVRTERVEGRLVVETKGTAVSLGFVVLWCGESNRWHDLDARNRAHELGHAVQSRMLGPLYLPLVGVPSTARAIYAFVYRELTGTKWSGYYDGYPERWADRLGGVQR